MAVKLTESQMTTLKGMTEIAGHLADQLLYIMRNHGLDKIPGCRISIEVNPEFRFTTEKIQVGFPDFGDFGYAMLTKGAYDNDDFIPTGSLNSAEYEQLFADDAVKARIRAILHQEKPLPPDGLWVGDDRNAPPVDCRGNEVDAT